MVLTSSLVVLVVLLVTVVSMLIGDYLYTSPSLDQRKVDYCEGCMKAYMSCGRTGNLQCATTGYCDAVKTWTE